MKIPTLCVGSMLVLSGITAAFAADANKATVYRDYTDTITPASQDAYEAGVKAWNQCLHEHGSKYAWAAWNHETGNVYSYSYVTGPHTWADFDAMKEVGKACDATWRKMANPHLKGETSAFLVLQPDLSHGPAPAGGPQPAFIDVTYVTLKNGHQAHVTFTDVAKKIAAAAAKTNWDGHYSLLQVRGGDDGAPDYIVVSPDKSWAEVGADANPPLWKMVEGAYGKSEADSMRKALNDATEKFSTHIDSFNADLSYTASK